MKDQKNIELQESGLLCDNPNCHWEDKTIAFKDCHNWINTPCPKCGDNLLTLEDYNNAKAVHDAVDLMNKLSEDDLQKIYQIGLQLNPEGLKHGELLRDAQGMATKYADGKVCISIDTHKEIRIVDVQPVPDSTMDSPSKATENETTI